MKQFIFFVRKEFLHVWRDKRTMLILFGMPLAQILIFGFALTNEVKNVIYFWKKHKPNWQLPLIKIFFLCGSLLRLLIFGIIKGDEKARSAYTQALGLIF